MSRWGSDSLMSFMSRTVLVHLAALAVLAGPGSASGVEVAEAGAARSRHREIAVAADRAWTQTGVHVRDGELVEIYAFGKVRISSASFFGRDGETTVGPEGTYDYPRNEAYRSYPLAAGGHGPTPPFGLIAKLGAGGPPFPIGREKTFRADRSGELFLGVNDFDHSDNAGALDAYVRLMPAGDLPPGPADARPALATPADPQPVDDAQVVLFFVDGLRHDALKEMAFAGYLPNIRELFFDGGIDVERTFSVAPSNTIVATTASLTGAWPDRSGIFTQLSFDRERGRIDYLATSEGPSKVAERLDTPWWQKPFRESKAPALLSRRVIDAGYSFASTASPVMLEFPPDRFLQRIANEIPLFGAHLIRDEYIDRAQTAYALEEVIEHDHKVMMVYYSGVDAAAHRSPRGLWGESRRDLLRIDRDIGRIRDEIQRRGLGDRTYYVLYADHGSAGGKTFVPKSYDIANELFYRGIADADGDLHIDADSGLGLNVLYQIDDVPVRRDHSDLPNEDYAVAVAQAYSVAWVALPKGNFASRSWKEPNDYFELARYSIHPDLAPVDLPRHIVASAAGPANDRPVAMVLAPAATDAIVVVGRDARAVIERRRAPAGGRRAFEYRYRVAIAIEHTSGGIQIVEANEPSADPLGYLTDPALADLLARDPGWLARWHDDREWLAATADAVYPDAVVAYAHALLDDPDEPRVDRNERYDMLVVAARGWNLAPAGHGPSPDHGGPDRESKQIPFLISGPNLARGVRVEQPARIIDVVPTVLELAGIEYDPATLDGRPVREIWDSEPTASREPLQLAFHWDRGLPVPESPQVVVHERLGHDFGRWYDLHNVTTNLATLTSQELVRVADEGANLLIPGRSAKPLQNGLDALARTYQRAPDSKLKRRTAELVKAVRLHTITVGELTSPMQSLQHIDRAALTIDWVRNVLNDPFEGSWWPLRFTPMTPIDFTLGQLSGGMLGARRFALKWFGRASDKAIRGIEAAYRSVAHQSALASWQTPRVAHIAVAEKSEDARVSRLPPTKPALGWRRHSRATGPSRVAWR